MKFLIIGYGSIGKRHARNILSSGHETVLLRHSRTESNKEGIKEYYSFDNLLAHEGHIDGAVVCSPTSMHLNDVKSLLERGIPFLLEKPPASDLRSTVEMADIIRVKGFKKYDIAFNLRYHPVIRFLKDFITTVGSIYAANIYVGYYLPYWRPDIDYRETSSAKKELGGGVHIELAHDIEYALWFLGFPELLTGYAGKVSSLEISTDDICSAILKYRNGAIAEIHLDYLSHKYLRGGRIIAEKGTLEWEWDGKSGKVNYFSKDKRISEDVFVLEPGYDFNNTYLEELDNFIGIIEGERESMVDIETALNTMKVIGAIERSADEKKWISPDDVHY
ncbi:MAG: Gfo/Idh/MocA family oxidoreductase [Proteobacteria bacterium]|nr:Gfo/Idh/MocA family oxidoreductase [Pseudomonadota bacterium]